MSLSLYFGQSIRLTPTQRYFEEVLAMLLSDTTCEFAQTRGKTALVRELPTLGDDTIVMEEVGSLSDDPDCLFGRLLNE
jgi:hypothetical protein